MCVMSEAYSSMDAILAKQGEVSPNELDLLVETRGGQPKVIDRDLLLETADGTGQYVGALKCGMLGLCGPQAREDALARLADSQRNAATTSDSA